MVKNIGSLGRLMMLLALSSLALSNSYAGEVEDFAPVFKMRTDLRCWPSFTNNGNNSGECRSRSDFESNKPPIYWEDKVVTSNGKTARLISYWVYYSHQSACSAIAGGDHVDDWEKITVHLENGELKHVTYNQHNGRYTLDKSAVPLEGGTHPVVYVGKYSHGSYHGERSRCTFDNSCYVGVDYCFYWKDPRGPGVTWNPSVTPLSNLSASANFPGSRNPLQRSTRPHQDKVCREDGGQDVIFGIGLENTCDRNPAYLKDEFMTLEQMAIAGLSKTQNLALKTHHGTYMVAEQDGSSAVNANRTAISSWERFNMANYSGTACILHGDVVSLQAVSGQYWRGNSNGVLDTKTSNIGSRARYQVTNHTNTTSCLANNDVISLKNTGVNRYVVAERNGDANVNRTKIGSWEKFVVKFQ